MHGAETPVCLGAAFAGEGLVAVVHFEVLSCLLKGRFIRRMPSVVSPSGSLKANRTALASVSKEELLARFPRVCPYRFRPAECDDLSSFVLYDLALVGLVLCSSERGC